MNSKCALGFHEWKDYQCSRCGKLGDEALFYEALCRKLKWRRSTERIEAVKRLGERCTSRSISALLSHHDSHDSVSAAVNVCLKRLSDQGEWNDLVAAFNEGLTHVQAFVVEALGRRSDNRAIPFLLSAMSHSDLTVRSAAVGALAESSDERAVRAAILALQDGAETIRTLVVSKLAMNPHAPCADEIIKRVHDSHATVRVAAVRAIPLVRAPNAFELIAPMFHDGDTNVQLTVVETLGTLKDVRAVRVLISESKRRHNGMGQYSQEWIKSIYNALKGLSGLMPPDMLMEVVQSNSPLEPLIGCWVANEFKTHQGVHLLASLLTGQSNVVSKTAWEFLRELITEETTPVIFPALKEGDLGLRLNIIQFLAYLKNETAIEPLIDTSSDRNAGVRAAAIRSLGAIGGTRAEEAIINTLSDRDIGVREAAIQALSVIGSTRAEEAIKAFAADEFRNDSGLAIVCIEALKKTRNPWSC